MSGLGKSGLAAACGLLQAAAQGGRQGNVLLIKHASLPWPIAGCVARDQQSFGLAVHLSLGTGSERHSGLQCRSAELPFEDACFRQVILWHVVAAGQEAELEEACRVLVPGGELLVLGLNQLALGARFDRQLKMLPRLHRQALGHCLHELGMEVTGAMGTGLAGFDSVIIRQGGWLGLLLPFADQLVLRVQHANRSGLTPLRLEQFQAGVAPSA